MSTAKAYLYVAIVVLAASDADAQPEGRRRAAEPSYPPSLPGNETVVTDTSDAFLTPPATLKEGVVVARKPPTVDFLYYPGQNYPGQPWSNWGDGVAANGKYYSAIGDHLAIGAKGSGEHGTGTGFVFEYNPETKTLRELVNVAKLLKMPAGHYTPGKIHSRLDLGSDGWLYFGTHRGSARSTTPEYHYEGDWIIRTHPQTGESEVVVRGPVPQHAIPNSVLDPERLIFYGGTAAGMGGEDEGIQFFAYERDACISCRVTPRGC
jgi:hypothetical protein